MSISARVYDKENDLKEVIQGYKDALNTFSIKKDPGNHATTQNNLGNVYQTLAEVKDKEVNLKRGIEAYEESLKIFTVEEYPLPHENVTSNLEKARQMASS